MECPRCKAALPDDARFCGMCGNRFGAGAAASPPAPAVATAQPARTMVETPIRYFQENTATTDKQRAEHLRKIAEAAMQSAPPPAADAAVPPAAAAAPAAAPEPAPAPVASSAAASGAGGDGRPRGFEFAPADLRAALARAAEQEGIPAPDGEPADVGAFYKLGESAGITRKGLGDALHRVGAEKAGVANRLEAPLTTELQPIQPSRKKLALVGGGVLVGLVLVGIGLSGGGEPEIPRVVTPENKPAEAPAAEAPPPKPRPRQGKMDTAALTKTWGVVTEKSQACHEAARRKNPKIGGKLVLDVEFAEAGGLGKLEVKEDALGDPALVACVMEHVKAAAWPTPEGGSFAAELPMTFQVVEQVAKKSAGKASRKKKK